MTSYYKHKDEENILFNPLVDKIKSEKESGYFYIRIPDQYAKKATAYLNMKTNFLHISDCLELLIKNREFYPLTIRRSLWLTIITMYGRQFTDASKSNSPKLEVSACFRDKNTSFYKTHEKLMVLRHNYTSHRGKNQEEYGICYIKINEITKKGIVSVKQITNPLPTIVELKKILDLLDFLKSKIEKYSEKYCIKVAKSFHDNLTDEEKLLFSI